MIVADRGKAPLEHELVIARTLNASREAVFAAWTGAGTAPSIASEGDRGRQSSP